MNSQSRGVCGGGIKKKKYFIYIIFYFILFYLIFILFYYILFFIKKDLLDLQTQDTDQIITIHFVMGKINQMT